MLSLEEFMEYSKNYNVIPIFEEIAGDILTPITIYSQLCLDNDYSYLLESADQGRYSFIGVYPEKVISQEKDILNILNFDEYGVMSKKSILDTEVLDYLKDYLAGLNVLEIEGLPPFAGGYVGYFGYEMISKWESIYHDKPEKDIKKSNIPMTTLVYAGIIIAIDHKSHIIRIIANIRIDDHLSENEKKDLYFRYKKMINNVKESLKNISIDNNYGLLDSDFI
ncbi:MAG: anthranilate synthase component I, partial [Halanaerobiales bacterium]